MTVAAQKDLFSKRYRRVRVLDPLEVHIHKSLVQLLGLTCRPGVDWWHTPNGGWRDIKTAVALKAMGVRPGVADFLFIWGEPVSIVAEPGVRIFPQNLFLELKRRGGRLSPEQEQFRDSVIAKGSFFEVADSIDAAVAVLKQHNILRSSHERKSDSAGVASPTPRSDQKMGSLSGGSK